MISLAGLAAVAAILIFALKKPSRNKPTSEASVLAEKMLFEAKKKMEDMEHRGRGFGPEKKYENVYSSGAIKIVKDPEFEGVSPPPKSVMEKLNEMAGGRKKISPVELGDFDKKVSILRSEENELSASEVPLPGKEEKYRPLKILKAWVDYKIFTTKQNWEAFSSSHKVRELNPDFSRQNILILVSLSGMPSGIFNIVECGRKAGKIRVDYKLNPVVMSDKYEGERNLYSACLVDKSRLPVELKQVP